jgi:hypothetical protein
MLRCYEMVEVNPTELSKQLWGVFFRISTQGIKMGTPVSH